MARGQARNFGVTGSNPPGSVSTSLSDSNVSVSFLHANSETLRRVLKADLHLASFDSSFDSSCWSAQVSNAFIGLQGSAMFKQKMLRATQAPMQEFICNLHFRHLKVWREAGFSFPRAVNKKAVTYHKWCGSSESGLRGFPFSIPSYLYKDLDKRVLRNFSRSDCVHTI